MTANVNATWVLVVNAGSSSLKYQVVDPDSGQVAAHGLIERIGERIGQTGTGADPAARARHTVGQDSWEQSVAAPDHASAIQLLLDTLTRHAPGLTQESIRAVGHRVVHGGDRFSAPTILDDEVIAAIEALVPLAPLHNPGNLAGIRAARRAFPRAPHVAVFDTAFHQSLPAHAYTYAVPPAWREQHHVRRYGFHGTSHAYVGRRVAALLGRPVSEVNTVVLHLGNGASATAVQGGRSIDTSMGLTPLEGLVMGTRPGDLDPALAFFMSRQGVSVTDYDRALNSASGLLGLTGSSDFREITDRYLAQDPQARLAVDVVAYRLAKYVGAYAVALGRLDAIAFTAGIGEHSALLRQAVVERLGLLGLRLDRDRNETGSGERIVSADDSASPVLVVPTNEELEIARQTLGVLR